MVFFEIFNLHTKGLLCALNIYFLYLLTILRTKLFDYLSLQIEYVKHFHIKIRKHRQTRFNKGRADLQNI